MKYINKIEELVNMLMKSKEVLFANECLKEIYKLIFEEIYNKNTNNTLNKNNILGCYKNSNLKYLVENPLHIKEYKFNLSEIFENLNNQNLNYYFPYYYENIGIESKNIAIEIVYTFIEWFASFTLDDISQYDNQSSDDMSGYSTIETSYEDDSISDDMSGYSTIETSCEDDSISGDMSGYSTIETSYEDDSTHIEINEKENDGVVDYGKSVFVRIESNPFKQENKFYGNFKNIRKKYKNSDISTLKQDFINDLVSEFNASEINITFEGSKHDFEDLNILVEDFNRNNIKKINLNPGTLIYDLNRVRELKRLRNLIENSDVDAIKDKEMLKYFDMYLEENNSVCVLATMSAGKSTLINALLGNKLLPSKNEACTAKLMHLKNNNQSTIFTDMNGKPVSNETLKAMNDECSENIDIYIEGPIRNFSDIDNFEIIDTPGPNNSQDKTHKEITYSFIKSDKKHMIIVVLDGLKLMTNDEAGFIEKIAREQGEDGKIDSDRFLFVINKADRFPTDDNEEITMKKDAIAMLKSYGIEKPRVHLISAYNGLLARLRQNNIEMSMWDEDELDMVKRRVKRGMYKFHESSDLSPSVRAKVNSLIDEYTKNEDYLNLAVATSGILALELTIKEYMNKYKNIRKVRNIVKVCKNTIDKNDLMNDIKSVISSNIKEKLALEKTIESLKKKINNDKKINKLKEEIYSIKFGDSLGSIEKSINMEFQNFKKQVDDLPIQIVNGKILINTRKANECIAKLQNKYEDLRADLISELGKSIKKDVTNVIDSTINKYRKYINSLCEDIQYNKQINLSGFIDASSPDFVTLAKSCVIQETLEIVETIENPNKKGIKRVMFWIPKYVNVTTYHNKKGIELSSILKFVSDAREDLHRLYVEIKETRDNAKQKCIHEVNNQINDFNKKIQLDLDKLSDLRTNINEKSNNIAEAEKEMKRKAATIKNIKQKLDSIMSI